MSKAPGKHKSNILSKPYLPIAVTILALLFIVLTWHAFATPVEVKEEVTTHTLKQNVTFNYMVTPKRSTLYPDPVPFNDQKTYFTQVTEGLEVSVKADIASQPPVPVEGTSEVLLKLQAGELWEREYVLSPQREFEGNGTLTVVDDTFDVPLQKILAFTKQVEEETKVYPRDGYTLNITPVVKAKALGTSEPLTNEFTPSFSFNLTQRELIPPEELKQEQSAALTGVNVLPGIINVLGLEMPVVTARYASSILTVFYLILAVWLFKLYFNSRPRLSDVQAINRRYRGRIVAARSGIIDPDMTVIRMATFKELLKLADERDKSIICLNEQENGKPVCRYCVPDGETLYCYIAADETPVKRPPAPRSLKERVIPKEGTISSLALLPLAAKKILVPKTLRRRLTFHGTGSG
ncbi:MAG: hypothetical protein H0Z39_03325 [Peptococcaceae bacterium]|nr:hypothetical protein [Peptococcaceae bacterium]